MGGKKKKNKETIKKSIPSAYLEDTTTTTTTCDLSHHPRKVLLTSTSPRSKILPMMEKQNEQKLFERRKRFGVAIVRDEDGGVCSCPNDNNNLLLTPKSTKKRKRCSDINISTSSSSEGYGTCRDLEKPYLRLTSEPKAEALRPLSVLKCAFTHVISSYREDEDGKSDWANEQLKSIRQDLTVQHLLVNNNKSSKFALKVYETHARLALERGDLNEFNQCQSVIATITVQVRQKRKTLDEFTAYKLLYSLVQQNWADVQYNMKQCINIKTKKKKKKCPINHHHIQHALEVVQAVIHNNYFQFFKLLNGAPGMSAYLMDFLVLRIRLEALKSIVKSYKHQQPFAPQFLMNQLSFDSMDELQVFLNEYNNTTSNDNNDSTSSTICGIFF